MVEAVHGTIVECNTAYGDAAGGVRDNSEVHWKLLEEHGWTKYFDVDLMDAEGPDVVWPIPNGKVLKENHVGKNILRYDSMLVLAHFKGHPMGGYGGALKQLSIGCASRAGKALIHSAGKTDDRFETWKQHASNVVVPGSDGRRRHERGAAFQGQNCFYQCDEEPVGGLRLLRGGRRSLHEGHWRFRIVGSGGHRPSLHRSCHPFGRSGPRALYGAREQPQRHSHHRGRGRAWAMAPGNTSLWKCKPAGGRPARAC